ncbi:transposase domain-containing protein [Streptomyces halobius]|uniref:Transposase domain-containing protein n=1 Tax=Streptomyces halobius TaxID=2879846 RepID=A0ABY4MAU7_9ACTN|nr:transposase domain-containing protein [Streptomyces halobius]UQA94457.1 transposase domain-containing protein [Streptomyces halobius]
MALFSPAPYLEVLRHLAEGLRGAGLLGSWRVPAKSSLFRARERLGSKPLRVLFAATAGPLADVRTPGTFWRGLRLVAVDGSCWDAADSPANEKEFDRPGNARGPDKAAFPQVRMAALVECGTHAVLDAELDGCRVGELTLSARLVRSTGPGMVVLADREFLGFPLWRAFTSTGTHLRGQLRGLAHSHVGWLFRDDPTPAVRYAPDLLADRDIRAVSRAFPALCVLTPALPFALGWAIGGTWLHATTALLWAGLVRIALLHHVTWSVNSLCHVIGRRPFRTRRHDRATNLWPLALLSFGESWHNLHHADPTSARHGVERGQLDPSAAVIRLLERLGWVRDVRWPTPDRIAARRT